MGKRNISIFLDNDMWIGYWQEFPDYMTQGKTLEELQMNLKDIHQDLTSGSIPCVRHVGKWKLHEPEGFNPGYKRHGLCFDSTWWKT